MAVVVLFILNEEVIVLNEGKEVSLPDA